MTLVTSSIIVFMIGEFIQFLGKECPLESSKGVVKNSRVEESLTAQVLEVVLQLATCITKTPFGELIQFFDKVGSN